VTGARVKMRTLAPGVPGAPVVAFAHGLEDNWASWQPIAKELDPDWRLVAFDLPWRPGNDYHWRGRSSSQWLGDGLDLLGAVPDMLIAHSYGANAALELLCQHDDRAGQAVALICPLYRQPHFQVTWRLFERAKAQFMQHVSDSVRARMGSRATTLEDDVLETMTRMAIARVGPSGFLAVFQQYTSSGDLPLERVDLPALILAGGADPTLLPDAAEALAARIPGAILRLHDDYDHFCHIRHASDVAALVTEFVAAVWAAREPAGDIR
jgi:pimeloyl-ACP methyl ester carboxylesterase